MGANQLSGNGQSQSAALNTRLAPSPEAIKNMGQVLGGDAGPIVRDHDLYPGWLLDSRYDHQATIRRMAQCVGDQVCQHLDDTVIICLDLR